jgi:hypothetical protein
LDSNPEFVFAISDSDSDPALDSESKINILSGPPPPPHTFSVISRLQAPIMYIKSVKVGLSETFEQLMVFDISGTAI